MSPKTNIIILSVFSLIVVLVFSYFYGNYTKQMDAAIISIVKNKTGLPKQFEINLEAENIHLFSPQEPFNFTAGSQLVLTGEARVFEGNVEAELAYKSGEVIDKQFTTAQAEDTGLFGDFTFVFQIPNESEINNRKIRLTVFNSSPKDGTRENQIYFPVNIK